MRPTSATSKPTQVQRTYRSINRPLTILGVERHFFFIALGTSGATFNSFGSLLGGLAMFAALYVFGRWATAADRQLLRIVLSSGKFRAFYDPLKPHRAVGSRP